MGGMVFKGKGRYKIQASGPSTRRAPSAPHYCHIYCNTAITITVVRHAHSLE